VKGERAVLVPVPQLRFSVAVKPALIIPNKFVRPYHSETTPSPNLKSAKNKPEMEIFVLQRVLGSRLFQRVLF
jgi:hypothetical protein